MKSKAKIFLFTVIILVLLHCVLSFVSFCFFKNTNYVKSFYALYLIKTEKTNYVEVKSEPKWVIIGACESAVYDKFLEENGLTEKGDKRMGNIHWVEKNGEEIMVHMIPEISSGYFLIYAD